MTYILTRSAVRLIVRLIVVSLLISHLIVPSRVQAQGRGAQGRLNKAFQQAANEFDVPRSLLAAIAYAESHLDDHHGAPSIANGYGVMHLVDNPQAQTLKTAAKVLQISEEALKTDVVQNIRGGAAVLRAFADEQGLDDASRKNVAEWYSVIARYSTATSDEVARLYADEVYNLLNRGFSGTSNQGETITVPARRIEPNRGKYTSPMPSSDVTIQSTDYGPALWVPASTSNYTVANRPSDLALTYVVIHDTEGSYASAINWFQNPSAQASAHYVIRSNDGQITQMVREKDIAWHAGNWYYNQHAIGIEHEGYASDGSWYTDVMYRASAALTRNICLKYGIPMDRSHIIGHAEVPNQTHTDPGPYWNWTYYMQLVTQSSAWSTIVDNTTAGRFTASANWGTSSYSSQRYGADYRYATPEPIGDAAWFSANIPSTGNYEIYTWYPANSGYNSATPYVITTSSGSQTVRVNQQINGGMWVSLGTFNLSAGDYNVVGVSRWTSTSGYIIADAVRIVRR